MTQCIWCKDSELVTNHVTSDLEATSAQQHRAQPGANATLIADTWLWLLVTVSECTLLHFLHALLSSPFNMSFYFQTGLLPVIAPSENLPELS